MDCNKISHYERKEQGAELKLPVFLGESKKTGIIEKIR